MKHILTTLLLGFFFNCIAQSPEQNTDDTKTYIEKGDFLGINTSQLANGQTETIIACHCSENTCYTVTTKQTSNISNNSNLLTDDCVGTLIKTIQPETFIQIRLENGTLICEGKLINFSNNPNSTNLLYRSSSFIIGN